VPATRCPRRVRTRRRRLESVYTRMIISQKPLPTVLSLRQTIINGFAPFEEVNNSTGSWIRDPLAIFRYVRGIPHLHPRRVRFLCVGGCCADANRSLPAQPVPGVRSYRPCLIPTSREPLGLAMTFASHSLVWRERVAPPVQQQREPLYMFPRAAINTIQAPLNFGLLGR